VKPKDLIPALLIATILLTACSGPQRSRRHRGKDSRPAVVSGLRKIVRVIDGDTFQLNGGDRVRLAYVNTPEKREELGPEATAFAKKRLKGKKVRIEGRKRDGYGRLIADVLIKDSSFAVELVRAGMAHLFIIPPFDKDKVAELLKAQRDARQKNVGIWATGRYQGLFHITSFHANPRGNDNFNLNGEVVRIACTGVEPASLKGYRLHNKRGEYYEFGDVTLPPGHTVLLHSGHGTDQKNPRKQMHLFWKRQASAWTNRGDAATLRDADGGLVDEALHVPYKGRRR